MMAEEFGLATITTGLRFKEGLVKIEGERLMTLSQDLSSSEAVPIESRT
jgi:hypothetical protein